MGDSFNVLDRGPAITAVNQWDAVDLAVDRTFFTADRPYVVRAIIGRVDVVGSDVGAVTAQVRKAASGTALASGTLLHTGTFNLKGTATQNQTLSLSTTPSDLVLASGDSIVFDLTGVSTAAVGSIMVTLERA